jgi:hypothetical protein
VRLEELRSFMHELVLESSLRSASSRVGLGHEALRKFINGETDRPHERTRRRMGQLFLERQKLSAAEGDSPIVAGQLKLLLPRGLDAARTEVRTVFDALRESGKARPVAMDLEKWLMRRLEEEYAREQPYPGDKPARRKPGRKPPES